MSDTLSARLRDGIVTLLSPLAAAATPNGLQQLLLSIGRAGAVGADTGLQAELQRLAGLVGEITALGDDDLASWDGIEKLLQVARDTLAAVRGAEAALADPGLAAEAGALGVDLAERLLALWLRGSHSSLFRTLSLLGLIVPGDRVDPQPMVVGDDGTVQRMPWPRDALRADRLGDLVGSAATYFTGLYLPGGMTTTADAHAGGAALLPLLDDLANRFGLSVAPGLDRVIAAPPDPPSGDEVALPDFPSPLDEDPAPDIGPIDLTDFQATFRPQLAVELPPILADPPVPAQFGVALIASSAAHPDAVRGYLLELFGAAGWTQDAGGWRTTFTAGGEVPAVAIGPGGLALGPGQIPGAELTVTLMVQKIPSTPATAAVVVGGADSSRLEIGTLGVSFGLVLAADRQAIEVGVDATSAVLVLAGGDDGFLGALLPSDGLRVPFSFGLVLDTDTGVHLRGGPGLRLPIATSLTAGPISLDAITVAVTAAPGSVGIGAGSTVTARLGPITAVVDGLGLQVTLGDAPGGGALGPVDLGASFLPPHGIGIAVTADVISGGGFIDRDPATGRYSGVLDLHAGSIAITAVGLLDTRLPGGHPGYALLLALRSTFPAVQIGFGFAVTGVGGLLALNRRVDVDVLRARLSAGTAGRILNPPDPIHNAPALLADLDAVFPIAAGVTVVGPTAQLIWADLVHFDIGVFIELPGPSQVVLLGSAYAEIARNDHAYLAVRVDIVGVIDLRAQTAAFDAVLVDSHLIGVLDITGGAAFRLSWGDQPYTVLSLGGFNPAYHPEPLVFPASLTPIAMVHGKPADELYLRFEGYLAITSNTLQFGAAVDARINSGGFTIHGTLGFDALIQFVPFHFEFDIRASVDVSYHGHTLAGLTLTGSLTGPGPVVLQAKVCIELLFFDICFSHTFTLGSTSPPPLPSAPDVLATLLAELADPARLHADAGTDPHVRLRPVDPALTVPVVTPLGALVWQQQRAPLALLITRVGGTPLPAPVQVVATSPSPTAVQMDWFAPGQFADLTDDEALNRPAYDRLVSGVRLGDGGADDGPTAIRTLTVHEIRLPAAAVTTRPAISFPRWLLGGLAGTVLPLIAVHEELWTVSNATTTNFTGAQARALAALDPDAVATPATDRLPAFTF